MKIETSWITEQEPGIRIFHDIFIADEFTTKNDLEFDIEEAGITRVNGWVENDQRCAGRLMLTKLAGNRWHGEQPIYSNY